VIDGRRGAANTGWVKGNPAICERRVLRSDRDRATLDRLAVEGPLEVRVRGEPAVVLMRTPGHDEELVTGYLIGEGFADSSAMIGAMVQAGKGADEVSGDVLDLPEAALTRDVRATRSLYSSAACGACGKAELGELAREAAPIRSALAVRAEVLAALPDRLREEQPAFEETGGLHAAGAFDADGALLAAREDVGRHNAVDKVVGWAARAGALPMSEAILCVSGRLSFEIVQKAIAAGFPVVAAVSAPSSLAVDLAERYRVTLCGFVRQGRFNIYAHPSRIS
jgi:FdhD protein